MRLTEAQYAAALADVDERVFTVTTDVVNLPTVTPDGAGLWHDHHRGATVANVPRIFAVAAVNEGQIEEKK